MTFKDVMAELKSLGTDQNRMIYERHGANEPMFGVSFAHIRALTRRIRVDQPLADQLWASGNHDARILATQVADPEAISAADLDA